ncbi:hypothetical protein OIU34_17710 [Pararhizobium sp. BT-229]|uniref:hypothetical protein n=1 Tax=Pararhizobium sp. BT-229 TaxID=2986923 RepID=UPI0021F6F23E|nr:hypothetical protein [Pararhizobium sp. BT-229]MCV9963718.1 hypothetical protein [Pararhizobium sp. BT-229]
MRDDLRFALVLRTGSKGFAPDCPFDFGICFVEGDSARTSFVDIEGLGRALGDFPTVPSVYGVKPGVVSFEAEMEAVDTLTAAAGAFSTKYGKTLPHSFSRLRERLDGGLVVSVVDGRVGFELAQWAAQALSWHVGDRVDVAAAPDGKSFAIFADRDGTALVDAGRPGWVSTARDWPLPPRAAAVQGEHYVPVVIADGSVLFELAPQESRISSASAPAAPVLPLPHVLPIDYRWGLIALAVAYATVSVALKVI